MYGAIIVELVTAADGFVRKCGIMFSEYDPNDGRNRITYRSPDKLVNLELNDSQTTSQPETETDIPIYDKCVECLNLCN